MVKTRFDFLKLHIKGLRILDVGNLGDDEYDNGTIHAMLRSQFPEWEIFGLDSNEEKAKKLNFPNQVIGTAEAMPFSSNYFGSVYMREILEHTLCPEKMIMEAHRVLKSGGSLILDTPNPYALSRILRFISKKMDTLGHEDHKMFYTPAAVKSLLERNNLKIACMSTDAVFGVMGRTLFLPRLGVFNMLGGHICVSAIK